MKKVILMVYVISLSVSLHAMDFEDDDYDDVYAAVANNPMSQEEECRYYSDTEKLGTRRITAERPFNPDIERKSDRNRFLSEPRKDVSEATLRAIRGLTPEELAAQRRKAEDAVWSRFVETGGFASDNEK